MSERKLAINICGDTSVKDTEQLALIKQAGFDGFFSYWNEGCHIHDLDKKAKELDLKYQSIHLPWNIDESFENEETGVDRIIRGLEDMRECSAPIAVIHPVLWGDGRPVDISDENFYRIFDKAREVGKKVAIENVGESEQLAHIMARTGGYDNVGFCWDIGHESCFNYGIDQLAMYGDKLIATHTQDNFGISDPDKGITYLDDLHLLPFDGSKDWDDVAKRLVKYSYEDFLTAEVKYAPNALGIGTEKYLKVPLDEFFKQAYKRMKRLADLVEKYKENNL